MQIQQQNFVSKARHKMQIKLPVRSINNQEKELNQKNKQGLQTEGKQSKIQTGKYSQNKSPYERQHSGNQSPISMRGMRTSSKIIQQPLSNIQQISQTQNQIHQLIDQLDFKLQSNYHHKQNNLIQSYRQELIKAHKDLIELKNNNNEQQIKNQMNQKFLQLKKQRLQLIQVNMFYSNKCIQYKKLLDNKISQGVQLQRQIAFLQKQINNSNLKKIQLMSDVYQKHSPIKIHRQTQSDHQNLISLQNIHLQTDRKQRPNHLEMSNKKISLSTHANTQVMKKLLSSSNSKDKIKKNLSKMPELNTQVKKLFQQKLMGQQNFDTDRSAVKSGTILSKISALQNQNSQIKKQYKKQGSQIEALFLKTVNQIKQKRGLKKQIALFKGQQFTDVQKRQIMKAFLSKEQVKQYIYNIIFEKADNSNLFRKKSTKDKFKIVTSENKQEKQEKIQ